MTLKTEIEQLAQNDRYKISAYTIDSDTIILFVTELNAAQKEIPETIFGRTVRTFKSI